MLACLTDRCARREQSGDDLSGLPVVTQGLN
jgi:hypothetical protein